MIGLTLLILLIVKPDIFNVIASTELKWMFVAMMVAEIIFMWGSKSED